MYREAPKDSGIVARSCSNRRHMARGSKWLVGRYVVMPDHVHFFCAPNGVDIPSLERWMQYWKTIVTKTIGAKKGEVWQRDQLGSPAAILGELCEQVGVCAQKSGASWFVRRSG